MSGIYMIVSPSGKAYIGSTGNFTRRRREHFRELRGGRHVNQALQNAFNKYGDQLFFEIVELCENASLIEREQWWLDNARTALGIRLYNASLIAGKIEQTPEIRAANSERTRRRVGTPEARAAQSRRTKALFDIPGMRELWSARMKALMSTPEARSAQSAKMLVVNGSPEARAANSARTRRRWQSPEARAAQSVRSKEQAERPEVRAKLSAGARKSQPLTPPKRGKYKGVNFDPRRDKWAARVKGVHLGRFASEDDAARAYDKAALEIWGAGNCYLNFPSEVGGV